MNYEQSSPDAKQNNESQSISTSDSASKRDIKSYLRTKIGFRKQQGYQPELVCLLAFGQRLPVVNSISINPKNSTLLFGTDEAFVCVDYATRIILYNVAVSDMYSSQELSHRTQKSPKKANKSIVNVSSEFDDMNLSESYNTHHLTKQFTIEGSFHRKLYIIKVLIVRFLILIELLFS